ncbi:MAG: hypothetical protein HZB26_02570 [Candidatus Hydrogenedentes bacterium]|nr:hypothetical protein [Candidatus Hydrogenedentota bacterium]
MNKIVMTLAVSVVLSGASFVFAQQEGAEAYSSEPVDASASNAGKRTSMGPDAPPFAESSSIAVMLAPDAPPLEDRVAKVLSERIRMERRSPGVAVAIARGVTPPAGAFRIFLGRAGAPQMDDLCKKYAIVLPGRQRVAPESFALKTITLDDGAPVLVAVGADGRGVLYAAGEILRRLRYRSEAVAVPGLDMQSAPAYRFRGASANQGGTMRRITGARAWTVQERHDYMIEQALAGANTFYADGPDFDFVKEYDLMTVTDCRPNEYKQPVPKAWQAAVCYSCHTQRQGWACPSAPESHKALLDQWDKDFAQRLNHDVLRLYAGDPGGCRCPRCKPWGKTFVHLSEEIANLWLKQHPNSIVQIANQDLSNDGDQAIFDYLNEKPRPWLEGIAYGPGSNAMSSYFRGELREDLFEYPGAGPVNRYLAEMLNQLPKSQKITHYSDITHWISAQYQVEHPDPHIEKIYGRRTFHTRPQAFYDIFQSIMPFSEGDIIYSEGYHDELHQWMWNRLLWNSNQSLRDVLADYFTYFMGPEYMEPMSAATLQLEKNLEAPLATNDGVDRFIRLVKEGGKTMPDLDHFRAGDHRWLEYLQKAVLDKYFQLKLRIEQDKELRVTAALSGAGDANGKLAAAKTILAEQGESSEMAALREEARVAGEASDRLFGVRNVGYFAMDKQLTNLGWTSKQIERALLATATARGALLADLVGYEDPGPGGFYDDAGNTARQPHLVRGDSYDGTDLMDPDNRPSQNTLVHSPYSLEDARGVVFRYSGLEAIAHYRVRATLVLPRIRRTPSDAPEDRKLNESILADDVYLAKDVEIPEYTAKQFEYDVPQSVTQDGVLELAFERGSSATGIVVSEVWLLRK